MHISTHILVQLSMQRRYTDFLGIIRFKILLSMLRIDLNANKLHILERTGRTRCFLISHMIHVFHHPSAL